MSDVQAKAEARRAKIAARAGTRLLVAKGEKDSLGDPAEDDGKVRERPLAARRNLVAGGTPTTESKLESTTSNNDDDNDNNVPSMIIRESSSTTTATIPTAKKNENPTESSGDNKSMSITSQRTRKIEQEIARNTAKFDENIVKKDEDKSMEGKNAEEKQKVLKKLALKATKTPLKPHQIVKFIRLLILVVVGMITGYQSAMTNMHEVVSYGHQKSTINHVEEGITTTTTTTTGLSTLHAFVNGPSVDGNIPHFLGATVSPAQDGWFPTTNKNRTWFQWLQNRFVRQLQCSLTAVSLVGWVVSMCISPLVNRAFPKQQNSGVFSMQTIINLYSNGVEGLIEIILSRLGEWALHVTVTVATAMVVTFFLGGSLGDGSTIDTMMNTAVGVTMDKQTMESMQSALGSTMEWEPVVTKVVQEVGEGILATEVVEGMVEAVVDMVGETVVQNVAEATLTAAAEAIV